MSNNEEPTLGSILKDSIAASEMECLKKENQRLKDSLKNMEDFAARQQEENEELHVTNQGLHESIFEMESRFIEESNKHRALQDYVKRII